MTECTAEQLEFHHLGRRSIVGKFDGGTISSDGGGLLLREVDMRIGMMQRVAECFTDWRRAELIEHPVQNLVAQRIYALALGYEDLNDHEYLRRDSVLAALVGSSDLKGERREREQDRGCPLAGPNTLNRLELSTAAEAPFNRYKKIVADMDMLDRLLVDLFLESYDEAPEEIWLDLDATDDPLHGEQEGRFFNGYYDCYCYLPLYIFCGEHLLCARLRSADKDASDGSEQELTRIVAQIRTRWPDTRICIRGDSGFCRNGIMSWCEANKVKYLLGFLKNDRLLEAIREELFEAKLEQWVTEEAARCFGDFRYQTRKSWDRERRVVGKAEVLADGKANPRFVVTNIAKRRAGARKLYEELYCIRGDMENRIKEQQLGLFADRTSCETMKANQLRLYFSSFAYTLMQGLRRLGLSGTSMERAQCTRIRESLLKLGARITISVRRLCLSFTESYPYQGMFHQVLTNLRAHPMWHPSG